MCSDDDVNGDNEDDSDDDDMTEDKTDNSDNDMDADEKTLPSKVPEKVSAENEERHSKDDLEAIQYLSIEPNMFTWL